MKYSRLVILVLGFIFSLQVAAASSQVTAANQPADANTIVGVKWLHSFLSADKRKTYCLYEAENGDAIREAARRAGLPADIVIELAGELRPEALLAAS